MKRFTYRVIGKDKKALMGEIEAKDAYQAASFLRGKGYFVVNVDEVVPTLVDETMMQLQKPKLTDISNFTRQLSTMVTAGLQLVDALDILKNQSRPAMARIITKIAQEVEGGMSLADAMGKKQRRIFTGLCGSG